MTEIKLYNTATRKKEVFAPLDPENVRMYVCGPTVYDRAHLGNARPAIVFDVLNRLLRHVYGADHVTYVRNITDVDDKINAEAQRRKAAGATGTLEELIAERAEETIRWYHEDMAALGVLPPDHEPRATRYIAQMIGMIDRLIADGFAYEKEGHVLFRVRKYADYGKLSGRSVDDMIAGARVEVAPYKEDPMDFVLWKPSSAELPGWDSPWGRGRPGWHIECSAMAAELLGETFDIHGGGNDLQFPHHENEIAQSKCAGHGFARYWLHNEMLQVEGKKMSKSLGNFFTVRDLLNQGVPGEVIRFVMLSTHYRKPMDWTEKKRREAERTVDTWLNTLSMRPDVFEYCRPAVKPDDEILEALADDLNSSLALTRLAEMGKHIDNSRDYLSMSDANQREADCAFVASALLLGFDLAALAKERRDREPSVELKQFELLLVHEREQAKENKDFSKVDALKEALKSAGLEVRMSKDDVELVRTSDFDPSKLAALK